jgi:hypothetical protein
MGIQEVTRFFAAVKSDLPLRQAVAGVTADTWPEAAREIAKVAGAHGYHFSGADYEEAVRKALDQKWWRYRELDSEQEKLLGSTAAEAPFGAEVGSDLIISDCVACPTRIYTPCGC